MSEVTLCPGCGYGSTGGNSFDRLGRRWHDSCFEEVHPNAREALATGTATERAFLALIELTRFTIPPRDPQEGL